MLQDNRPHGIVNGEAGVIPGVRKSDGHLFRCRVGEEFKTVSLRVGTAVLRLTTSSRVMGVAALNRAFPFWRAVIIVVPAPVILTLPSTMMATAAFELV